MYMIGFFRNGSFIPSLSVAPSATTKRETCALPLVSYLSNCATSVPSPDFTISHPLETSYSAPVMYTGSSANKPIAIASTAPVHVTLTIFLIA